MAVLTHADVRMARELLSRYEQTEEEIVGVLSIAWEIGDGDYHVGLTALLREKWRCERRAAWRCRKETT
jgi:hypothetical protein